ncbi:uncharacterized protein EV422DRAFT_572577 [Fimicolochytrium jonesii]|uniref:uncharacterized protein n=1 Tax=Fimicolochytrium jonesii TaxID=1396493 RepID=UPI0022FE3DFC|nr:uncharacterized protein EV422DRAFT_572577 [Fimicolochytrium jonesii]KAI8815671.1 hypothetical protein EV422DRAFT_572577 [Fimicolochytrium jonesii]
MDAVAQRQVAIAILVGVWGFKLQQVWFNSQSGAASQHYHGVQNNLATTELHPIQFQTGLWCLLDLVYFISLWRVRIPRLDFRFSVFAILILASWMLDLGVAGFYYDRVYGHRRIPGGDNGPRFADKQYLPAGSEMFNDSHIIGSHLVHVLPPTLAKLNPGNASFCLGLGGSAHIPLKIKGTPPWKVSYEFYGLDGTHKLFENIEFKSNSTGFDPRTGTKSAVIDNVSLPADKPGIYRLVSVKELVGDEGKVLPPNLVEVVHCPSGNLLQKKDNPGVEHVDRCVDQSYDFTIALTGTPPFSAWYTRKIGDASSLVKVEGTADTQHAQPFKKSKHPLPADIEQRLIQAQSREVRIPVEVSVQAALDHTFMLLQVVDGRGNTVRYKSHKGQEMPPAAGNTVIEAQRYSDTVWVKGRPLPSANFGNCQAMRIRPEYPDESAPLPVRLTGTQPWQLRYARAASEEDLAAGNYEARLTIKDIDNPNLALSVKKPGYYSLLSIADAYCPGTIELPTTCEVQQAVPPTMNISVSEVVRECFGATGVNVNVSMTGEPPFWVHFEQRNKGTGEKQTLRYTFAKAQESLKIKPQDPGEYEYAFPKLGDAVYTDGVDTHSKPFTQVVHALPDVTISVRETTRCLGDTATLDLHISGVPPYSLTYTILRGTYKEQYVRRDIREKRISVETPALEVAGTYFVDLIDLTDGNGCTAPIESKPVSIEVLGQRPSVQFKCPKPLRLLEGSSIPLPVAVSGHGNYKLTYRKREDPDRILHISGARTIDALTVSQAGTYELQSFQDGFCAGRVLEPHTCEVVTIPKPALTIPETEYDTVDEKGVRIRRGVCEGTPDKLSVHLQGKPQFKIKINYRHLHSHRMSKSSEQTVRDYEDRAAKQFAWINLITDVPGQHVYEFRTVSDDNYADGVSLFDPLSRSPPKVAQTVHARPKAVFLDKPEKNFQCISDDSDTGLQVELTGQPPFSVEIYRKHESQPRDTVRLTVNTTRFTYHPDKPTTTGKYTYTLRSVSDASGCDTLYRGTEPGARVTIQVADIARITRDWDPLAPLCAGDMLSYSLEGTGPFTLSYTWNRKPQKEVVVTDPVVLLYAGEAGTVNVTRVCNSVGCCYRPPGGLVNEVRAFPRAIVDGGEDLVEDIREGDESIMRVEFVGIPPFTFKYQRTPLSRGERTQAETFTVENILENTYTVGTDKEGKYRVTSIKDRYCQYPPRKMANPKASNAVLKAK